MNFLSPLFLVPLIVGIIFILTGYLTLLFPPKEINSLYGYRTPSSKKSKERWDFAQSYSSKLMVRIGILTLVSCLLSFFVDASKLIELTITLSWIIILSVYLFVKTEKALKSKFD